MNRPINRPLNTLTYGIAVSIWTLVMLGTGYMARDYADRNVTRIEQLQVIGD